MNRSPSIALDRHLFASNASAYDAAWESYGWTPGLDRARAGRLEERVPWAADLADRDAPPVLIDGSAGARSAGAAEAPGIGALPEAFLPMDGRLGFSVSGIVRETDAPDRPRSRPRVATHTLLFDLEQFEVMDGYPQGMHLAEAPRAHVSAGPPRPAEWFVRMRRRVPDVPQRLSPVTLSPDRERLRALRLADARRSVAIAAEAAGLDGAKAWLLTAIERLASAVGGDPTSPARARLEATCEPGWEDAATALVRAAWLTLPIVDRRRVRYATPPLKARSRGRVRRVRLAVGPDAASMRPPEGPPPDGVDAMARRRFRRWIDDATEGGARHEAVARLLDVRGLSLFSARSGPYALRRGRELARPTDLAERLRVEDAGRPRWRALGWQVGRAAARPLASSDDSGESWEAAFQSDPRLAGNPDFLSGVARGLRGRATNRSTAWMAVVAGLGCRRREAERPLVDAALGVLVSSGAPATDVGAVVRSIADLDGREEGTKAMGVAVRLLRSAGRALEIPLVVGDRPDWGARDPALAAALVDAAIDWIEETRPGGDGAPDADALLRLAWRGVAAAPHASSADALHRLAWLEARRRGAVALAALIGERGGDDRPVELALRLLGREPDPPIQAFLALRAALVERGRWPTRSNGDREADSRRRAS